MAGAGWEDQAVRWVRRFWDEEGIWFYFELDDDGWVTRHIELQGPDRTPIAAASLSEWFTELDAGRIQQYRARFGVVADQPIARMRSATTSLCQRMRDHRLGPPARRPTTARRWPPTGHRRGRSLFTSPGGQQSDPRAQLGRHIQHPLTRGQQLLSQQMPRAAGALDRPGPLRPGRHLHHRGVGSEAMGIDQMRTRIPMASGLSKPWFPLVTLRL